MQKINCHHCGAPAEWTGSGTFVCPYCGAERTVEGESTEMARALTLDNKTIHEEIEVLKGRMAELERRIGEKESAAFELDAVVLINQVVLWVVLGASAVLTAVLLFFKSPWALLVIVLGLLAALSFLYEASRLSRQRRLLKVELFRKAEEMKRLRGLMVERAKLAGDRPEPDAPRPRRCESCGGDLVRVGPARFICPHCETSEVIDRRDRDLAAGIHLDDQAIAREVGELKKHLAVLQEQIAEEKKKYKEEAFSVLGAAGGIGVRVAFILSVIILNIASYLLAVVGLPVCAVIMVASAAAIYYSGKERKAEITARLEKFQRQERVLTQAIQAREKMLEGNKPGG